MESERGVEVIRQEASGILLWADSLVVNTLEDYKGAIARLQDIKAVRSKWVAYWLPLKSKAHAAWKEVVAREADGLRICDDAERMAKVKAITWKQGQDRKAEEERIRLQAKADEDARREKERLEREAEKLKTPELKEARLEEAAGIQAPVITIASPVADVEGASARKTWKAELVDMDALIAAASPGSVAASFLQFNEQAANNFARSTKGKVEVAGIRFFEEEGLSIRKGG